MSGISEASVEVLAKRLADHARRISEEQFAKGYVRTDWTLSDVRQRFRAMARRDLEAIRQEESVDGR